jgi:phosphatidyl-myo-inositol dimannoside synthase
MNLLALLSDAFGSDGGIAEFNRHLLRALATDERVTRCYGLARSGRAQADVPEAVRWAIVPGKVDYVWQAMRLASASLCDLIVCAHVNLMPLALAIRAIRPRARLWTVGHGIEIWKRPRWYRKRAFETSHLVTAVSEHTKGRILTWADIPEERIKILPNCVDATRFTPGERPRSLAARYGLEGRRVALTVGRLSAAEQYKGHDRVLRALPAVLQRVKDLSYLIVGDGDDRSRLQALASSLGISGHVVFAGHVPADEVVDHYRLADVFVMPSAGEGFGIVYLEAAAVGLTPIASDKDAGAEIVSKLGGLRVRLNDAESLAQALVVGLRLGRGRSDLRARAVSCFGLDRFRAQVRDILMELDEP